MFNSLYIGATGMQAQQLNVDTIANNLANVNTPGFKKGRVSFTDLVIKGKATSSAYPATPNASGAFNPVGVGVGVLSTAKLFEPGELKKTDSQFDVAVQGDGFLELSMPDGVSAFTRGGTLKVNEDRQLATLEGTPLKPGISIPADAQSISISSTGRVQVTVQGQSAPIDVGQLEMVRFANARGLSAQGGSIYKATDSSGEPISGRAGEDGMGTLAQGFIEGSNVKMIEEVVNLMVAQRAYEANVKVVQAADEILGMINGLRR